MAPRLPIIAGSAALARSTLANGFEHPETIDDTVLLSFAGSFADPAWALALEELIASLDPSTTVALDERLAGLHTPTLIVWGTDDVFFDVAWARWLERTIPGTRRVVEVEGAKLLLSLRATGSPAPSSCGGSGPNTDALGGLPVDIG